MVTTKILAWAMVAILVGAGTLGLIQWGKIKTLEADLSNCQKDLGAADISLNNLNSAIAEQNKRVSEAEALTRAMKEQGDKAREQARKANEAHQATIARLQQEEAASQSCEQVRQKLINEATGYEFR